MKTYEQLLFMKTLYPDIFIGFCALSLKYHGHWEQLQHINTITDFYNLKKLGLVDYNWFYIPLLQNKMPYMPDAVIFNPQIIDMITIQYKYLGSSYLSYEQYNCMMQNYRYTDILWISTHDPNIYINQKYLISYYSNMHKHTQLPLANTFINNSGHLVRRGKALAAYKASLNTDIVNIAIDSVNLRGYMNLSHSSEACDLIRKLSMYRFPRI